MHVLPRKSSEQRVTLTQKFFLKGEACSKGFCLLVWKVSAKSFHDWELQLEGSMSGR